MGSLVQFKPRATVPKGFTHLHTYDRLAQHELVLVRGYLDGAPHLSLMLTNLPNEAGWEILITSPELDQTRAVLDAIADAVCLAVVHLTPNGEAWA